MRIGYILKKFPRLSETFILNELLALEAAGVEVEVFSLHPPDDEPVHASLAKLRAPVTVIRSLAEKTVFRVLERWAAAEGEAERGLLEQFCGRLQLHDPWRLEALNYAAVLAPLVQDRNIQHLHAHFATSAVATAAEVARLTSIPYSFTMHAKDIYRRGVNYSLLSERMAEAAFTRTVCEANARWLRQCCSAAACERLRVLYNGLDLTEWVIQPEPRERGLVVAVGRFVEKKGFHLLLQLFQGPWHGPVLLHRRSAAARLPITRLGPTVVRRRSAAARLPEANKTTTTTTVRSSLCPLFRSEMSSAMDS